MGIFDIFKKKKTKEQSVSTLPNFTYTEEQLAMFYEHIEKHFGEIEGIVNTIPVPGVSLDIAIVPPTEQNNYYKCITMGMGAYRMNVPESIAEYQLERAELVVFLPPEWDVKSQESRYVWPLLAMANASMVPADNDMWIGAGQTIMGDANDNPYDPSTGFCSMLMFSALDKDFEKMDLEMAGLGKINFYQMMPLYPEEMDYKRRYDMNKLIDRFEDKDLLPIVNNDRKNYGIE